MTLLSDILATDIITSDAGTHYRVMKDGLVVFSADMTDYTLTAMAIVCDPDITADELPDKYMLAATYWIMHRWYSTRDANQSNYYRSLYDIEIAKTRHNRLQPLDSYLGDDL